MPFWQHVLWSVPFGLLCWKALSVTKGRAQRWVMWLLIAANVLGFIEGTFTRQ